MTYHQITGEERYALAVLRQQGHSAAAIARHLGRHRSTITREVRRNGGASDGAYRPPLADWYARGRRWRSRRNRRFSAADQELVGALVRRQWSPEQIAGRLRREGRLCISHETIYRWIWADKRHGGQLHTHLRWARKLRRKRSRQYERRGHVEGRRPITARPAVVERRTQLGHWEADTMVGPGRACLLSLVERKSGFVVIGQLPARTTDAVNRRATQLIARQPHRVRTITADNGTEFHRFMVIERATAVRFYFATPHHAWERGTNENTNGLIRRYVPKRQSMAHLTQHACEQIATALNRRPRKRLGYRTPEECYVR